MVTVPIPQSGLPLFGRLARCVVPVRDQRFQSLNRAYRYSDAGTYSIAQKASLWGILREVLFGCPNAGQKGGHFWLAILSFGLWSGAGGYAQDRHHTYLPLSSSIIR